jgi:sulfite exporter TauE/SafE
MLSEWLMNDTMWVYVSAVLIALTHTVLGPDHYLPFVAMSRAGEWSTRKTAAVTALCGVGHVLGSITLGMLGLAAGLGLSRIERWEEFRGDVAGWLLLGFGLAYLAWGVRLAIRNRPHTHVHVHADGTVHSHTHRHDAEHAHAHGRSELQSTGGYTPWILFTIFLFGPCEPLIPLLMYPAATRDFATVVGVAILFGVTTVATMLMLVLTTTRAATATFRFARYGHALAGMVIVACGVAVRIGL